MCCGTLGGTRPLHFQAPGPCTPWELRRRQLSLPSWLHLSSNCPTALWVRQGGDPFISSFIQAGKPELRGGGACLWSRGELVEGLASPGQAASLQHLEPRGLIKTTCVVASALSCNSCLSLAGCFPSPALVSLGWNTDGARTEAMGPLPALML